ncbi:MAG: sugar ABC transporter substrate-binding protein [Rickettsiales bacterium]
MHIRRLLFIFFAYVAIAFTGSAARAATTLRIATVNNNDMAIMQKLSSEFLAMNPGIRLEWTTLDENALRRRVTEDADQGAAGFDVITIGSYEAPLWGKKGLIEPMDDLPPEWNIYDVFPSVANALSSDGKLYAAPFYAEGVMTLYRTDLFKKWQLSMPGVPDWNFIKFAAKTISENEKDVYGICLRGKPGWGENVALITAMAHSYGARWFDENWNAKLTAVEWKKALSDYVELLRSYGPPDAASNGFNENLALFAKGKCGIWIDATVAGSFVTDANNSYVGEHTGFAPAPMNSDTAKQTNWLWVWALAVPSSSLKEAAAKKFIAWATSAEYIDLAAKKYGWANVPPGARASLYANKEYMRVAPFAETALNAIRSAHPGNPGVNPTPYDGMQYVSVPEFQEMGNAAGEEFAAALTGKQSVAQALFNAKNIAERKIKRSAEAR